MDYEFRAICKGETRRLLWLMGIMFAVIVAFQYIELPYDTVLSSLFSASKVPAVENNSSVTGGLEPKSEIVTDLKDGLKSSSTYLVHEIGNDTRTFEAEGNNGDGDGDGEETDDEILEESSAEKLEDRNKYSMVDTFQNADNRPAPEGGRESEKSIERENISVTPGNESVEGALSPIALSPVTDSESNLMLPDANIESGNISSRSGNVSIEGVLSTVPLSPVRDLESNVMLPDANVTTPVTPVDSDTSLVEKAAKPILDKNGKSDQSNFTASHGSSSAHATEKTEILTPSIITIHEMKKMLLHNRASYHSMRPRWSSTVDQELLDVRSKIENAPLIKKDNELYAPLYRNVSMFKRSYELMEEVLKVYVYKEGQRPILHVPVLKGIYASEGWFMKQLEASKHFVTKDAQKAHLFYLPFSSRMLEETLYVQNSHSHKNLIQFLRNYVHMIAAKYNFWNRTDGADHFLVACHDWAPAETRLVMAKCIRALCNSDIQEGFVFGKDVSLPETYVRTPQNPLRAIGGNPASKRSILAFFAGGMHGYVRPILLQHWENKDPDMKIFGQMPKVKGKGKKGKGKMDYIQHMKSSKYCICAKGYEVNSPRVVEAISYECVPVIISDNFVPPFFEILTWESFAVFVLEKDIPNLKNILLSISDRRYRTMQMRVKRVQQHFLWHSQPAKYDLFHMILHSIWYNRVFLARAR